MRRKHRPKTLASDYLAHPWRQVRIFITGANIGQAYLDLLGYLVQPLAAAYPATPLWFTRYGPLAEGEDNADTNMAQVPADWRRPFPDLRPDLQANPPCTFSVRLRWAARKQEEAYIVQKLNAAPNLYWYSSVLDFDAPNSFAEPRVYAAGGSAAHKRERANLVCHTLSTYSRFILHNLISAQGVWQFENNPDNWTGHVNFRYPLHMLNNASAQNNGNPHPVAIAMTRNHLNYGGWVSL